MDDLIGAVKSKLYELVAWFAALPGRIMSAIGSIDIASKIRMPSLGGPLSGGGGSGSVTGAMGNSTGTAPPVADARAGLARSALDRRRAGPRTAPPARHLDTPPKQVWSSNANRPFRLHPTLEQAAAW